MTSTPPRAASPVTPLHSRKAGLGRNVLLFTLLFLICLGLGYPTLNRYDPRGILPDSATYTKLATDGPGAVEGHMRFRVLVPYLVRPIYRLAQGRVGSWDPLLFGFLTVNSLFVAGTAYLLVAIGTCELRNRAAALLAATLYLLNFATPNLRLAGLVDSGEGFFLIAIVTSLFFQRWWPLPALGLLGTLTKESFLPFSITMALTWWLASDLPKPERRSTGSWLAGTAIIELLGLTLLQFSISGRWVWPWVFAQQLNSHSNYVANFLGSLADRSLWYIFLWLLPLGLVKISYLPRPWIAACGVGSVMALLLNAYYGSSPGTVGRALFSIAGPLLSLSAAAGLCDLILGAGADGEGGAQH